MFNYFSVYYNNSKSLSELLVCINMSSLLVTHPTQLIQSDKLIFIASFFFSSYFGILDLNYTPYYFGYSTIGTKHS